MKTIHDILKLGDPRLYEMCEPVFESELANVQDWVEQLHEAMEDIRRVYQFGRGIAAPQLGIMKRMFYLNREFFKKAKSRFIYFKSSRSFSETKTV